MITISNEDGVLGQAIRVSSELPLIISKLNNDETDLLINFFKKFNIVISGVTAPSDSIEYFTKKYAENFKLEYKLGMHMSVYELQLVQFPSHVEGHMIQAKMKHIEIIKKYCLGYLEDCLPFEKDKKKQADDSAQRIISNQTLYLWENKQSEIVSMVSCGRETRNASTLSWVYTPVSHRSKGYAAILVATLSKKKLDEGKKFCNLFADELNPTSNSIYKKMGYTKIGESSHYIFSNSTSQRR